MKVCSACKNSKSCDQFGKWSKSKDGLQSRCLECQRQYQRDNYRDNPKRKEQIRAADKKARERNRDKLIEFFLHHPCVDCGNSDIRVLEFDHLGDKDFNISFALRNGTSWAKIEAEIAKCEVRCANCHRVVTCKRNGSWRTMVV